LNFFSHAVLAFSARDEPEFWLGAMVPDFFSMAGIPCTAHAYGHLGAGMAFHHRSDDVFHRHATFTGWQRAAFEWLTTAGVERGPARAVAHMGVELLLDAELCKIAAYRTNYLRALATSEIASKLHACTTQHAHGFYCVRGRLIHFGAEFHVFSDTDIATRFARILARRPRLALAPSELPAVTEWVTAFRGPVRAEAEGLVDALRIELALPPP
jgi:hypothetical protein